MERFTYQEIQEFIPENFSACFRLGDSTAQAAMRLRDSYYREILEDSPLERLMLHAVICRYLIEHREIVAAASDAFRKALEEVPLTEAEQLLTPKEYQLLRNDCVVVSARL